jgi:hypothetical protein
MSSERRYSDLWHSSTLWLAVAYLLTYSLTRWYHLTSLPIHYDEIVYLFRVNRIVSRHDFFIELRENLKTRHQILG